MFLDASRVQYRKPQLVEVICQLRFPAILSIGAKDPVDFQERIRREYPRYSRNIEKLPPKLMGQPGNMKLQEQPEVVNHQFLSADGRWKVNMTNNFIALATPAYTTWEAFAARLDFILASFVELYEPAYFERIGLRYINAISRRALELEDYSFADLIQPAYLGLLSEEDVQERAFLHASQEAELNLPGGCRLKLKCGPGMVKRGKQEDKEIKFILDEDLYMAGKVEIPHCAAALNTVHIHADRVFRGAITQTLHNAMEPEDL